MARLHTPSARRGLAKTAARARLAGTILTAAALLVVPIVLWAQYGDGEPEHAIAVAIVATLLCWWFIHRLDAGHGDQAAPASRHGHHQPSSAGGRKPDHHRPARSVRPGRDIGCTAAGQWEGHAARRRHP